MVEPTTVTILDAIIAHKRTEITDARKRVSQSALLEQCEALLPTRNFIGALGVDGISAIAEFKKTSPSAGVIREGADAALIAGQYRKAGAACLSVLTDAQYFGGSADDLHAARGAVDIPILRKDFIVEPYQIYESRVMGADAVLLIACCMSRETLTELRDVASDLGLAALVEIHDETDVEKIDGLGLTLVGVNNRNLRTMEVDIHTSVRLYPLLAGGTTTVSESGIRSHADVVRLHEAGFDAILVGESLMRADHPGDHLRSLLGD